MKRFLLLLAIPFFAAGASRFTAEKTTDRGMAIVRLTDNVHGVTVSVAPSLGNRAYQLEVHGSNLLYVPDSEAGLNNKAPGLYGIPFLAPWANRIAGGGFWADGREYLFNPDLGTVHLDDKLIAIHGMLSASPLWEVTEVVADQTSARVTSRLQFWKYPDLMANWPFAQEYEMTYRLTDQGLQVTTVVKNLSTKPMPLVIGFHPYFHIPGVPRAQWVAHIPAQKHVETDANLVATGTVTGNTLPDQISLKDHTFDDGFTDLKRDNAGNATLSVQAGAKTIQVVYGPHYQAAVVYAPPGAEFICFEPMAAITNGVNLAHEGKYSALQTVAPGASWSESFWVEFAGF